MMPKIQQLAKKKARAEAHSPGKKVLWPRNSSWKPCCNHAAWVRTQSARAVMPSLGRVRNEDRGK